MKWAVGRYITSHKLLRFRTLEILSALIPFGRRVALVAILISAFILPCGLNGIAGSVIDATLGKAFEIDLDANPSTGYSWNPVFDSQFLALTSRNIEHGSGKLIGAPVKERFTFVPLKTGTVEIEFRYFRSWEKESVKIERFSVDIKR